MRNKNQNKISLLKWLSTLITIRTLIILLISCAACFVTIYFQIKFSRSILLFSLLITFPLLFTIQQAFKRRERALEYLSLFRAAMQMTHQSFYQQKKLSPGKKKEIGEILTNLSEALFSYLKSGQPDAEKVYEHIDKVFLFMQENRKEISSVQTRILRFMENVYTCTVFLVSLTRHGTMVAIRVMASIFINLFPLLQAPMLYSVLSKMAPDWTLYVFSALAAILLMIFFTIQQQIENPFNQDGLDDICLDDFKLSIPNNTVIQNSLMEDGEDEE